jgi:peptidoglycan/LPS O-acetylase OafA/YrhL
MSVPSVEAIGDSAGQPRERLAFIHALRGVAAMLVVWAHLGTFWPSLHGETSYLSRVINKVVVTPLRIYQEGGHLGVILFFFISGYIITYTALREDRVAFSVKRVFRLVPPLVVATAAVWGYITVTNTLGVAPIAVHDGDLVQWVRGLFLVDGWFGSRSLDVTWTLVVEVTFYSLTLVLLNLTRRRPDASTWAMSGLWVAVCVAVSAIPALRASMNATMPAFVAFLLVGRSIYLWKAGLIRPMTGALNAALAMVLFVSFMEDLDPGWLWGSLSPTAPPVYSYFYALIGFLAMMAAAPRRVVQPFTLLGDVSYSLYLLHVPVGFLVFEITSRWGFPPDVMIVLAISASIGAAWVSYVLVEKPAQRMARDLLARRRSQVEMPAPAEPD